MINRDRRPRRGAIRFLASVAVGTVLASCSTSAGPSRPPSTPPSTTKASPSTSTSTPASTAHAAPAVAVRNALLAAMRANDLTAAKPVPSITSSRKRFGAGIDASGARWVLSGFPKSGVTGREWSFGTIPLATHPAGFIDVRVFVVSAAAGPHVDDCQVPWTRNLATPPATTPATSSRPCQIFPLSSSRALVVSAYTNLREMYVVEPGIVVAVSAGSGAATSAHSESLGTTAPPISIDEQVNVIRKLIEPAESLS